MLGYTSFLRRIFICVALEKQGFLVYCSLFLVTFRSTLHTFIVKLCYISIDDVLLIIGLGDLICVLPSSRLTLKCIATLRV